MLSKKRYGFILPSVLLLLLFLATIIPIMYKWVQHDTRLSVKDRGLGVAFSLAETAVDRGYWKVKSSTFTFATVMEGGALSGYRFDATYRDLKGGTYRIYVSSGPLADQLTVIGEGRDYNRNEVRSLKAIYSNSSVPGAIISGGNLSATGQSVVHWGPILAMGDLTVSGNALNNGYPRKLSRQTVLPLDTTGDVNPPNTDGLEWWSNYNVPELPQFDFTTMRASAAATGTLNCQTVNIETTTYTTVFNPCSGSGCSDPGGSCSCSSSGYVGLSCTDPGSNCSCTKYAIGPDCQDPGGSCSCSNSGADRQCSGNGCTDSDGAAAGCVLTKICTGSNCSDSDGAGSGCSAGKLCRGSGCEDTGVNCACNELVVSETSSETGTHCCSSAYYGGPVTCSYGGTGCTDCSIQNLYDETSLRDKDYTWYWDSNVNWSGRNGLRGTMIVRGDLGITGGDNYCSNCTLAVPPAAWKEYQKIDTSSINQYPADTGAGSNAATYRMGSCGTTCEGGPLGADLGVYGFLYVGGDFNRQGDSDVYGAIWVVGNVTGAGNTMVFYNSQLRLPTLNVMLTRESWEEQLPSPAAWE